MKVMELSNIVDSLEENELTDEQRLVLVEFLYKIVNAYELQERKDNVLIKLKKL